MLNERERIACRIAKELHDGDVVNLGIGLPTLVTNYIPAGIDVTLQAENGILGMGNLVSGEDIDKDCINAGNQFVSIKTGASYFDSATSFGIIRGGHVDITVLGALQIDEKGNLASHIVPGKMVPGMGGAMDLVAGAKKVIIGTLHTQKGAPKLYENITLPATAIGCVDMIITELAVIQVTDEGFLLLEIARDTTVEKIQHLTAAKLQISDELKIMNCSTGEEA